MPTFYSFDQPLGSFDRLFTSGNKIQSPDGIPYPLAYSYIIVDPNRYNATAIRAYKKAGFKAPAQPDIHTSLDAEKKSSPSLTLPRVNILRLCIKGYLHLYPEAGIARQQNAFLRN